MISLQTILNYSPLIVGGRTSLELQGYAHYLAQTVTAVHLYGLQAPPPWLHKLPLSVRFVFHNHEQLFNDGPGGRGLGGVKWNLEKGEAVEVADFKGGDSTKLPWGQWAWPLILSSAERATLELLDEIPNHETFVQVDALFGGLSDLRPARLQKLLADCASVKVKRLFFFFFADRHRHAWLKRLDKAAVDFGRGKRMLARGGVLDRAYQITVPGKLDGVR